MIKDTIRTSKSVNSLTDFQFRVWLYLITFVDDFGRGSADPELLKGLCFPRRKGLTEDQIEETLGILASKGMISLYKVDGEPYFYFPKWSDHQRVQTKQSKCPEPPEITEIGAEEPDPTAFHGGSPLPTVDHRDPTPEIEIETNKKENKNKNINARARDPKEDDFDRWWDLYPKKSGDIRLAYQEYLFALDDVSADELYKSLKAQVDNLSDKDLTYFPSADKWLRNRTWRKKVVPKQGKPRAFTPTEF